MFPARSLLKSFVPFASDSRFSPAFCLIALPCRCGDRFHLSLPLDTNSLLACLAFLPLFGRCANPLAPHPLSFDAGKP